MPADRPDAQPPEPPRKQELEILCTIRKAANGPEARHNTAANHRAQETILDTLQVTNSVLVCCDGHIPRLLLLYDGRSRFCTTNSGSSPSSWGTGTRQSMCSGSSLSLPLPSHQQSHQGVDNTRSRLQRNPPPRGESYHIGLPLVLPRLRHHMWFTLPPCDQQTACGTDPQPPPADEPGTVFPSGGFLRTPDQTPQMLAAHNTCGSRPHL